MPFHVKILKSVNKIKPNLLILGASGGVSRAFLQIFSKYRKDFNNLVFLDKNDDILNFDFIDHKNLDYKFFKKNITNNTVLEILRSIKKEYDIDIVLDLTDYDTFPILQASDYLGVCYLNCSLNSSLGTMSNFVGDIKVFSTSFVKNTHVLSLGMNPGIIHQLIIKGSKEYGLPNSFVEIEYDSASPVGVLEKPYITWSPNQFLNESVWSNTGYCNDKGEYVELESSGIDNLFDTKDFIEPIKKMDNYPLGMLIPHDEVIAMSRMLEIPGKFIYAIPQYSLNKIIEIIKNKKEIKEEDLIYLDNVNHKLTGSDFIGVWLNYDDKDVCYYFDVDHESIVGTNATLYLVAVGVLAGLVDIINNNFLDKGILSASDLNHENFLDVIQKYVQLQKIVIKK